ncbi:MAG: undecaprenyl-diphosphate phosphatase [Planctomycetota bacterium]
MPLLLVAVLLGLVEGLTEFLPVSSTAHLALAQRVLPSLGAHDASFRVAIQVGAVAAVAWVQRARFGALLRPAEPGRFGGTRGLVLLALVTAPVLAVGFVLRHRVEALQEQPLAIAAALAVGGLGLLALERWRGDRGTVTVDGLAPLAALGIGCFQCLSLWPGMSRSASTIAGAMLLGLSRRAATELSFLAAVPAIVAATGYAVVKDPSLLSGDGAGLFAAGTIVAAISGVIAVRAFTAFVARSTMRPFAWYRLALAALVAFLALA